MPELTYPKKFGRNKKGREARTSSNVVRQLVALANKSDYTYGSICAVAGYSPNSFYQMKAGIHTASIQKVEALGEVLGYHLEWVKNDPS